MNNRKFQTLSLVLLLLIFFNPFIAESQEALQSARVNGVELHYLEAGTGIPVIFVHGGLVDYRRWSAQIEPFSQVYHVLSYSRRYNFPNKNAEIRADHSATVEAEDLAALIKHLKLEPAHVIGESYGAYTALLLAIQHPKMVRSLILAEAPVMDWLKEIPEGKLPYDRFMNELWRPVGDAFKAKADDRAIRIILNYFIGEAAQVPDEVTTLIKQNLFEWKVLADSTDPFPDVSKETVRKLDKPVLMMTGENTLDLFKILEPKTESMLPNVKRVIVPKATHEMWEEFPEECRKIAMAFLAEH